MAFLEVKAVGNHCLPLPKQETPHSAGYDLRCSRPISIQPGKEVLIPTGYAWAIPLGYVGIIKERSGLSWKQKISIHAGVIDADYRGEVKVLMRNRGSYPQVFEAGDKIAQMVITPYLSVPACEVGELQDTERGENGFGSTGK